jgi:phosphatidylglycerophosphate synthase
VFDQALRLAKERLLEPFARRIAANVPPVAITVTALLACVGAGVTAGVGWRWLSVALWLTGRLADGLDGPVARRRNETSDLGGFHDMLGDTVGYAAVPLGVAASVGTTTTWAWAAVLLATFYVNTMSWTYLSALAEKRAAGASARGELTSVHMPSGLVEGTETIVLFTVMLAVPTKAAIWFAVMAGLVAITVGQRLVTASRVLR